MSGRYFRSALLLTAVLVTVGVAFHVGRASAMPANPSPITLSQGGGGVCYHVFVSDYVCPDSAMRRFLFPKEYIEQVNLTVVGRDGQRRSITMPGTVDAVFLTQEATEKFLLSYYWSLDKVKAERLMRVLAQGSR